MTQSEKRIYLIKTLLEEQPLYNNIKIPTDEQEQRSMLRTLFNIRMPEPVSDKFLSVQNSYLREETNKKGITDASLLQPVAERIYIWQGDITTLKCDAIVNAANSQLLGCFHPCHKCIDNQIHTFAGIQLRLECNEIMLKQRHEEKTGQAKITSAYNLPCKYILHTVGPIVTSKLNTKHKKQLASCYQSCLELAEQNNIKSIAFCCISTGEFCFPNEAAALIAVDAVKKHIKQNNSKIEVIFNVFKDIDYSIYKRILEANSPIEI